MKIRHILFPIDLSASGEALNPKVEWLASHFDAHVTLMHVFEVPTRWYGAPLLLTSEAFLAYVKAEKSRLNDYPLHIPESKLKRVFANGSPAWNIAQWTRDHKVDLVVMGTHGYDNFERLLLGSVAMNVLHDVECPVWTYPPVPASASHRAAVLTIVCALELTKEALPLLLYTLELADEFKANVVLVHGVPQTEFSSALYLDRDLHSFLKKVAEEEIAKLQGQAGTNFPVQLTDHSIALAAAEIAREQGADLIVIGRGVIKETFGTWRTSSHEIIRQAPCPVLSYPINAQEPEQVRQTAGASAVGGSPH